MASAKFLVKRQEPRLVTPAKPTPHELKQLSDIDDQESLRFQIPVIMFYKNDLTKEGVKDPVEVIREALSRALVFYYPLAGRLMVDCNEKGVLFIEGDANFSLEQLGDSIRPPCPFLDQFLFNVPDSDGILGCPLLLIQVTRLTCGGFVLALRLNHTMCDAQGLVQLLTATAEVATGVDTLSMNPVWQREVLNGRNPPRVTRAHHEYEHVTETNQTLEPVDSIKMDNQSFFIGPKEIKALKKHVPPHLMKNCSKFEMIIACLWKCRTVALNLHPNEIVRFSCVINARNKLHGLHLPPGYYGNVFVFPAAITKAEHLCSNPLGYAIELVKNAKAQMSEEYVRSVADLMVINGRQIRYPARGNFIVSDTTRAGLTDVDFGWGKPVYAGPAGAVSLISFVVPYRNKYEEDGVVVPMCLPRSAMKRFENELKKMTMDDPSKRINTKLLSSL